MPSEPPTGSSKRRHRAPPTGYNRIPSRSVSRMKATTANPVNAPMTSASTRNTWSSRSCSLAARDKSGVLHQRPLGLSPFSLISQADPPKAYRTELRWEDKREIWRLLADPWKGRHSAFRFEPPCHNSRVVGNPEVARHTAAYSLSISGCQLRKPWNGYLRRPDRSEE